MIFLQYLFSRWFGKPNNWSHLLQEFLFWFLKNFWKILEQSFKIAKFLNQCFPRLRCWKSVLNSRNLQCSNSCTDSFPISKSCKTLIYKFNYSSHSWRILMVILKELLSLFFKNSKHFLVLTYFFSDFQMIHVL